MPSSVPDPFYYLANFQQALAWLDARCADLFDGDERRFAERFPLMPRNAQALLVRMLMRKGPYFRAARVQYAEIGCPREAAAPLVEAGWLDNAPALTFDALAPLVTKAELVALAAHLGIDTNPRDTRTNLLDTLRDAASDPRAWREWYPDSRDTVLHLAVAPLCERLRLMFFGNLRQDWSEFVLADLGVYRYEPVPLDAASRAFQQRDDIDAYLALRDCRDSLDIAASPETLAAVLDRLDALSARTDANPWLHARHDKLRYAAGRRAERSRDAALAWRAYAGCQHPDARYRCVRVLEQLDRRDDARSLAREIAAAPRSEAEAQRAARTLGRLARGRGNDVRAIPSAAFSTGELHLPAAPGTLRVEEAVRAHLSSPHAPVFYVENTLINSLFGLLCWPALFAPLPGAFFHPFQRGPADLHAPDFVTRRAAHFAACLAELDSDRYRDTIRHRYFDKMGTQSTFVAWTVLMPELLQLALDCFPAHHLRHWFERLLLDLSANRSGLPDLVRFWPAERRYELIEVKGPGDRLQDNQQRWLAYCAGHGMPVSVLQVRWATTGEADLEDPESDARVESGAPR